MNEGHKKLQIYCQAHDLAIEIHRLTLALPAHERYEEGSQLRRSSKSVAANIVEGYALRKYKNEFIHYLFRAYASCEETLEHLQLLFDTKSLTDEVLFNRLNRDSNNLCGKILRYIQAVDQKFETPSFMKENGVPYVISDASCDSADLSRTPNLEPPTS